MMNEEIRELTQRFDNVILAVLGPLRLSKQVDRDALAELKSVLDGFLTVLRDEEYVPRKLVGDLWDVFCSMLAEADHAKDPQAIRREAWEIQEQLRRIFGPEW